MDQTCYGASFFNDPNNVAVDDTTGKIYSQGETKPMDENKIIFYSIGCPACCALKRMLDKHHIIYETVEDAEKMRQAGMTSAPMLYADGQLMTYKEAIYWLQGKDNE